MKQLIYKTLVCLLITMSTTSIYAQGQGPENPEEGGGGRPGPCICYPKPQPSPYYSCSNVPIKSVCTNMNLGFEDGHYFKDWVGNHGVACKRKVEVTNKYDVGLYNAKAHGGNYFLIDNAEPPTDPFCGFPTRHPLGGNHSVRLGDFLPNALGQTLMTTIEVNKSNPNISLLFAFVLSNICGDSTQEPFFGIKVYNTASCREVFNLNYRLSQAASIPGLQYTSNGAFGYKDWASVPLDLSNFFDNPASASEFFTIEYTTTDCGYCVHTGYGYVDAVCGKSLIIIPPRYDQDTAVIKDPEDPFTGIVRCVGADVSFISPGGIYPNETYLWDFNDGKGWSAEKDPTYFFTEAGIYNVNVKVTSLNMVFYDTIAVKIIDCCSLENVPKIKGEDCITTFSPIEGETYVLHAWVKEDISDPQSDGRIVNYSRGEFNPHITLTFSNESDWTPVVVSCSPSGPIIDGWQRIEKEFTIPSCPNGKINMDILLNDWTYGDHESTYFDDIRIFPKKGGMKSFVYDPASQKLLAELDEENFATFYEYDQEGALIRVKKETERGIKTLKEAGNNTKKP